MKGTYSRIVRMQSLQHNLLPISQLRQSYTLQKIVNLLQLPCRRVTAREFHKPPFVSCVGNAGVSIRVLCVKATSLWRISGKLHTHIRFTQMLP